MRECFPLTLTQIQVTTDTMIKEDSTEFGACSLPLSIVLMYLIPAPAPNPAPAHKA